MRNVRVLAAGLLALIAAAACAPTSEPGETGAVSTGALRPVAVLDSDTPTPPATSEPPPPAATGETAGSETPARLRENVAVFEYVSASTRDALGRLAIDDETARLATDGDLNSFWNSGQYAPQWFSVVFDDLYLADRIELVVAQAPAGPTTHEIWVRDHAGTHTLYKRFSDVHTEDGQILDVPIDPPRSISDVLIRTLDSPSWVAWREVRVFGRPSPDPLEMVGAPLVKLEKIVSGLEFPVRVTHAGDGSGRIFAVEQRGRIRIIKKGLAPDSDAAASVNDTPYLDISERVSCCHERGLFDVAFPPGYAAQQHFYVSYTDVDGHTIISRFKTSGDPDRADPGSEEIVLTIDQPYETHNGGRIVFGPQDGYLYIGSGDGGAPMRDGFDHHAQDGNMLLGKILRIDVESGVKPYGIPASNPFTQIEGYRNEIWALGLRNPWGLVFDKQTGALYIPDVGNAKREEVNYQPASSAGGENYGWHIMEGNRCFELPPVFCNVDVDGVTYPAVAFVSPVAVYDHSQGCAIVGGGVYRGATEPGWQDVFLYADFCTGQIWGLRGPVADYQDAWQSTLLIEASFPISSIGEDEEGNVYVVGYQDGSISMITER